MIKDLELLSPFGQKNPEPIFRVENVKIDILQIFKNKHAKLKIFDDLNYECEGMFFDIISEMKAKLAIFVICCLTASSMSRRISENGKPTVIGNII